MINVFLNIINILILSFNISIVAGNISIEKRKIRNTLILTAIIFTPSFIFFSLKMSNLLMPSSLIIVFLYYYQLSKKVYNSILISIITQVIFAFGDIIIGSMFVLGKNYLETNNEAMPLIMSIFIVIVSYVISKWVNKCIEKYDFYNLNKLLKKDSILLVISLAISLFAIYFYSRSIRSLPKEANKLMVVSNVFLLLSFFILITAITYSNSKSVKNELENKHKELQLNQLKEYTQMLETVSSDLRSFKHDYANIIGIIGDHLEEKDYSELEKFYRNELMPESKKIIEKDRSFTLLNHIKIYSLKGLISSKIVIAQGKEINVKIEISDDIDNIAISLIDICRIMGVLLDNAIEAAELCSNKFIELLIYKDEGSTVFIISNSCALDTPPVYMIYEKNFSTKGPRRGIGLKSVRNIINEKYSHITLNTIIQNGVFKQELIISQPLTSE